MTTSTPAPAVPPVPPSANLPPSAPPPPVGAAAGGVVTTIGDIGVTLTHVITPVGVAPVGSVQWYVVDQTRTVRRIPRWAVVAAVVGFFFVFVFALLFLLARENVVEGTVQVSVQGPGLFHSTSVPVTDEPGRADITARVNQARSLTAFAGTG